MWRDGDFPIPLDLRMETRYYVHSKAKTRFLRFGLLVIQPEKKEEGGKKES